MQKAPLDIPATHIPLLRRGLILEYITLRLECGRRCYCRDRGVSRPFRCLSWLRP